MMYKFQEQHYDPSIDADYVSVWNHGPAHQATNQQPSMVMLAAGTLAVSWTQASVEAAKDESVVFSTSADGGKTWLRPAFIEQAVSGRTASWAMLFAVLHNSRIYAFYWWNENANHLRDAGSLYFKFTDDRGKSWSARRRIVIPRHDFDSAGCELHGWNTGFPLLLPDGAMLMGFTKIAETGTTSQGSCGIGDGACRWWTEVFFLRCANILTEDDPAKLVFEITPENDSGGLWVPDDEDPELHFTQEPYTALLNSGRLITVMRTMLGYPVYATSDDLGRTWTKPLPLRIRPGGETLKHVCGPCQISSTPDGRVYFLFSNRNDPVGGPEFWARRWCNRDPIHVVVGRELPLLAQQVPEEQSNAGLYFDSPRIFLQGVAANPDSHWNVNAVYPRRTAAYPQLFHCGARHMVIYSNQKADIRLKNVPAEILLAHGIPHVGSFIQ